MPHINRIRVNNIKYNGGTQFYDDFHMNFGGRNALYDLANGGGKSVLMLLLLQNLLPNCSLDEKQPIEKLFRTGEGSTVIHSLIEWKLDKEDEKKSKFKYMTTGFCAKKGKDRGEEENKYGLETSSIEYFNYCIFYSDFNDYDIRNLPLIQGKERITYSGLRKLLKELSENTNLHMAVTIFDKKAEYQQFIARYGLYESQWEIIRGINKTEGHVRTYFETNYRSTRKVVEELFIEEIIEKAYRIKTSNENEGQQLAQTLLDIKDKIVELSKKKAEIVNYDLQVEALEQFLNKLDTLSDSFEFKKQVEERIFSFLGAVAKENNRLELEIKKINDEIEDLSKESKDVTRKIETLKLQEMKEQREDMKRQLERVLLLKDSVEESLSTERKSLHQKEAGNYYLQYVESKKQAHIMKEEINHMRENHEELLDKIKGLVYDKKLRDDKKLNELNEQLNELSCSIIKSSEDLESFILEERKADNKKAIEENKLDEIKSKAEQLNQELIRLREVTPVLLLEELPNIIKKTEDGLQKAKDQLEENKGLIEEKKSLGLNYQLQEKDYTYTLNHLLQQKDEMEQKKRDYQLKESSVRERGSIYNEMEPVKLKTLVENKYRNAILEIGDLEKSKARILEVLEKLEEGVTFMVTKETEELLSYMNKKYNDGVLGVDLLDQYEEQRKEEVLEKIPFLPYAIVLSDKNYMKLKSDDKPLEWSKGSSIIPIVNKSFLDLDEDYSIEKILFAGKEIDYFINKDRIEIEKRKAKEELSGVEKNLLILRSRENTYQMDLNLVKEFVEQYIPYGDYWSSESIRIEKEYEDLLEKRREAAELEKENNNEILALEITVKQLIDKMKEDESTLYNQQRMKEVYHSLEENLKKEHKIQVILQEIEPRVLELKGLIEETKKELEEKKKQSDNFKEQIKTIREQWKRYEAYYVEDEALRVRVLKEIEEERKNLLEANKRKDDNQQDSSDVLSQFHEDFGIDYDAELEGILLAYEKDNADVVEKDRWYKQHLDNMKLYEKEMKNRKVQIADMEVLYTLGKIVEVSDHELEEIKHVIEKLEKNHKEYESDIQSRQVKISMLIGKIELVEGELQKNYGKIEEYNTPIEGYHSAIKEHEKIRQLLYQQGLQLKNKSDHVNKQNHEMKALKDRVQYMIELHHITLKVPKEQLPELVVDNFKQYEEILNKDFNQAIQKAEKGKQIFENAKSECIEQLKKVTAYEFAEQLNRQVKIPTTKEEILQLSQMIGEACELIQIEKANIETGLKDIERIKESFENQCLQRCNTVRRELDKFPKLSSIIIDDELTQIVKLRIPYVKEEAQHYEISRYIDRIIGNIDHFDSEQEKMKYVISELSLKKLFSVIVIDMNRISLELYKRERIKEQSRHLRYEEAVGSTGQSQGIYIQFLIAIINYIANINSYNAANEELKKVIFIDNPFGAAKDTYIWEPIFAMLESNNVQLIVPTRGATPAITGKFDVNYILNQKLINGRQQTVVADYRSEIDASATEYIKAEYVQERFL